jgi:adenylate cyclase
MGVEIERKFLVDPSRLPPLSGYPSSILKQAYLSRGAGRTVRVRIQDDEAFLTIKGPAEGISRLEFEYPIPKEDAAALLLLCDGGTIDKTRYQIPHDGFIWELDVFRGDNEGLIVAEIELPSPETPFARPPWVTEEVSTDHRYANSALIEHPYSTWKISET